MKILPEFTEKTADFNGEFKLFTVYVIYCEIYEEFQLYLRESIIGTTDFDGEFEPFPRKLTVKITDFDRNQHRRRPTRQN